MRDVSGGPVFTGLVVYRNLDYRYSFFYPDGWRMLELESEGGQGMIFIPAPDASEPDASEPGDVTTSFSVEARDLGLAVAGDDLPTLLEGVLAGLQAQPDSVIEAHEADVIGPLLSLEARHTYRVEGQRARRWVRLLYQGTTQVRLIAQGAPAAQFDYWLPAFTQMMRTFRFGDWWADVTGQEWLPSLEKPADDDEPAAGQGSA